MKSVKKKPNKPQVFEGSIKNTIKWYNNKQVLKKLKKLCFCQNSTFDVTLFYFWSQILEVEEKYNRFANLNLTVKSILPKITIQK